MECFQYSEAFCLLLFHCWVPPAKQTHIQHYLNIFPLSSHLNWEAGLLWWWQVETTLRRNLSFPENLELCDFSNRDYHNINRKQQAWRDISALLDIMGKLFFFILNCTRIQSMIYFQLMLAHFQCLFLTMVNHGDFKYFQTSCFQHSFPMETSWSNLRSLPSSRLTD